MVHYRSQCLVGFSAVSWQSVCCRSCVGVCPLRRCCCCYCCCCSSPSVNCVAGGLLIHLLHHGKRSTPIPLTVCPRIKAPTLADTAVDSSDHSAVFDEMNSMPSAGLNSKHLQGWDRRMPMYDRAAAQAMRAATRAAASDADTSGRAESDSRTVSLVQTKLLEKFAAAVAQRGGVDSLRKALRYADTNGDGACVCMWIPAFGPIYTETKALCEPWGWVGGGVTVSRVLAVSCHLT